MDAYQKLIQLYGEVRSKTEELCQPLAVEDYVIQSVEDVSPAKWHLAHTTWFFETFILARQPHYTKFNASYHYLFNSYYQTIGEPYPRIKRGILSRPTVQDVYSYRHVIDQQVTAYLSQLSDREWTEMKPILILGLHHEQQHQELLLMDIKHNFSYDPNFPIYSAHRISHEEKPSAMEFFEIQGGLIDVGYAGKDFCFDNELPRHAYHLKPFKLATRLVTNGEFYEFIAAKGYEKPDLWLSDGWDLIQKNKWQAPLYWHLIDNKWHIFTLNGLKEMNLNDPVVHVSYYEADAYARFKNLRLPSEMEWEYVVTQQKISVQTGNFLETNILHPRAISNTEAKLQQLFGDVWEWTMSPYSPYPGYQAMSGALGEYNGKFMNNQMVLRGGSCVTPRDHVRVSYRNFFQPDKRWQFSGIRLASHL
jgi:ergothioneine biosynthesis protein EgtB